MKDLLIKIKEAEQISEREILEFKKELQKKKEEKVFYWEKKISEIRKKYEEKKKNIINEIEPVTRGIENDIYKQHFRETEDLKKKSKDNFSRFFDEVKKKII